MTKLEKLKYVRQFLRRKLKLYMEGQYMSILSCLENPVDLSQFFSDVKSLVVARIRIGTIMRLISDVNYEIEMERERMKKRRVENEQA